MTKVDVRGNLILNSTFAVIDAARDGIGLSWLVGPDVEEELNQGHLESVLDPSALERAGFFLYFPKANATSGLCALSSTSCEIAKEQRAIRLVANHKFRTPEHGSLLSSL